MSSPREVLDKQAWLHDVCAKPLKYPEMAEYLRSFGVSVHEAGGLQDCRVMFYPTLPHQGLEEAAALAGIFAHSLFQAQTFLVTPEMVDAVTAMYLKTEGELRLRVEDLPSPHGFCWLDKPLEIADRLGRKLGERAFSWELTSYLTVDRELASKSPAMAAGFSMLGMGKRLPAVRLTAWNTAEDESLETRKYLDSRPAERAWLRRFPLALSHTMVAPLGYDTSYKFTAGRIEMDGVQADNMLSWVHTLWAFMATEVVTQERQHLNRAARRQVGGSVKQPDVRVVLLRRAVTHETDEHGHPRLVDWSCRWVVVGHYRHLEEYSLEQYSRHHAIKGPDGDCGICGARITWVRPYVKGPDGKPLKGTAEVLHKLAR